MSLALPVPASSLPRKRVRATKRHASLELNRLGAEDKAAHDWYRFVLSYPPHLVRDYAQKFGLDKRHRLLDPFCGTGTTLVEAKKLGIPSVGIEAHPMSHFASATKVSWEVPATQLIFEAEIIAFEAEKILHRDGIIDDPQRALPPIERTRVGRVIDLVS